jgi:hypothetical protein
MSRDENDKGELLSSDLPTGPAGGSRATGSQVWMRPAIPFPRNHSHRERAWRPLATIIRCLPRQGLPLCAPGKFCPSSWQFLNSIAECSLLKYFPGFYCPDKCAANKTKQRALRGNSIRATRTIQTALRSVVGSGYNSALSASLSVGNQSAPRVKFNALRAEIRKPTPLPHLGAAYWVYAALV